MMKKTLDSTSSLERRLELLEKRLKRSQKKCEILERKSEDHTRRLYQENLIQKKIFYSIQICALVVDAEGKILQANDSFLRVSKASVLEVIGRNVTTFIRYKKGCLSDWFEFRNKVEKNKNSNLDFFLKSLVQEKIPIRLSYVELRSSQEENPVYMITFKSLEANERLKEETQKRLQSEAALEAKNLFLAMISHEMKTPLNAIVGMTDLITLEEELPKKSLEYLRSVQKSSETLLSLIHEMLDMNKIQQGTMKLEQKEFDVLKSLRGMLPAFQKQASNKGLKMTSRMSDFSESQWVCGDERRIRQVFSNLVTNAVKYTSSGNVCTNVNLAVDSETENTATLHMIVEDSGIGMSEEVQEKIFEPFFQENISYSDSIEGVGLGLAITRNLVSMMGGEINCYSAGRGKGSRFEVLIPLSTIDMKVPIAQNPQVKVDISGKLAGKVLIAEDNPVNLKMMQIYLKKLGVEFDCVTNGLEALQARQKQFYPLILMDCRMPEMDGMKASQQIRLYEEMSRDRTDNASWIVAVTANSSEDERQECYDSGMNDFASKPLKLGDLREVFQRYSQRRKMAA